MESGNLISKIKVEKNQLKSASRYENKRMIRKKLYGNNGVNNNKKKRIDDIYKHYTPLYGNNKYLVNKYGINSVSNEGNKHESIFPNIFNNKSLGGNYSSGTSKIITNKRLKPIIGRKNIIKVNP